MMKTFGSVSVICCFVVFGIFPLLNLFRKYFFEQWIKIIFRKPIIQGKIPLPHEKGKFQKAMTKEFNEDRINKVYRSLLGLLDISRDHLKALHARGLTEGEIKGLSYKTLPTKRMAIVDSLLKEFDNDLSGVPGFWRDEKGNWKLAGSSGLAIPVIDEEKRIVGIKVRADRPKNPQSKYTQISSNPKPDKHTNEVRYPEGTGARLSLHWPQHRPKRTKEIRITEGELKADIATNLTGILTVSIPGVNLWRHAIPAIKSINPQRVLLAFDSDKDGRTNDYRNPEGQPVSVGKSLAQLYLAIKREGFHPVIETWEPEAGKGIDDVLTSQGNDSVREMDDEEADEFISAAMKGEALLDWVYVVGVKRFYHSQTMVELDKEQFADRFCHEGKGNPASNALRNPAFPKVDMPIYQPAKEQILDIDNRTYFNIWRPGHLTPVKGDVSVFIDHVNYILPKKYEADILMDWLAYCIQNPGKKIHWALLLQGLQGTGKSFFGTMMRHLLGPHNTSFPSNDAIHENFTGWQKSCQLIVIEELMARGRLDLMNKLKPMITQDIAIIREMHKPPYEQPNVFNLLMFTNHEDSIIIDATDRRYCVLFSPAEPREHAYYKMLFEWSSENYPAILHFLSTRDLSKFLPKAHAPMTDGKQELIYDSMTNLEAWLREGIESEAWPFMGDLVTTKHLAECLPPMLSAPPHTIGKALKACGAMMMGQVSLEGFGRQRLWCVRRKEMWAGATKEALSSEYARWGETGQPGGNPLMDAKPM